MFDPATAAAPSRADRRLAWQQRLERFASSGLSVAAFCRAEHLSVQSFYYWKRRLAAPSPSPTPGARLLPVHLLPAAPAVEVALANGAVLRLTPGCDLAFVRSLLDALAEPSC
jgi:transposase